MNDNIYTRSKAKKGNGLHLFFAIFILFWLNDGLFQFVGNIWWIRYGKIAVLFFWFLLAWERDSRFIPRFFKLSSPLLLFVLLVGFLKVFSSSEFAEYASTMINNTIYILILTAIFSFYFTKERMDEGFVLVIAWFVDIIICSTITLDQLNTNPMISRFLTTEDPMLYIGKNILPSGVLYFGHAYAFVFLIMTLCVFLKKTEGIKRVVVIVLVCYIFYIVLKMQFATSLLLSIVGLFFALQIVFFKKWKSVFALMLPMLFVIVFFFADELIVFLVELIGENEETVSKLEEIKSFITHDRLVGTDLNSRLTRYGDSLNAFSANYFFGALFFGNGDVGGHSELLDALALYGLVPTLCLVGYFRSLYKEIKNNVGEDKNAFLKLSFFIFIALSTVNTSLWSSIMVVFIIVCPFMLLIAERDKKMGRDNLNGNEPRGEIINENTADKYLL